MSFETHQKNLLQHQTSESIITLQGSPLAIKKISMISITKYPNFPNRQLSIIEERHEVPDFTYYLKVFLMAFTTKQIQHRWLDKSDLPFKQVDVYNMFQFHPEGIQDNEEENDVVKALLLSPQNLEGHFDTVVVIVGNEAKSIGLAG